MIGDEIGITEDVYQKLIGNQAVTIEVLVKRVQAKDQHILQLEAELSAIKVEDSKKEKAK